jgi:kynurenine formamidase
MSLADTLHALRQATWVDLTHAFRPGIPHYSAFPDEQREVVIDYDEGFRADRYSHIGQWGTHVDPPAHFVRGGRTLDDIPVTEMLSELVVLDATGQARDDPDFAATVDLIDAHEATHGMIAPDSFVALRTGWSSRWPDPDAMANAGHTPGWTVDALAHLIADRGVTAVGHEQTDTDPGTELTAGRVDAERYILEAGRWQIELMANLHRVPQRGALILATWPRPYEGTGFPARCIAFTPRSSVAGSPQ